MPWRGPATRHAWWRDQPLGRRAGSLAQRSRSSTLRRFAADRQGVGAIEFAILFPVLVMLYIGAFEITIGLSVSKRVSRAAGTVADMVTQQESVTKSILSQMPLVAGGIFAPYGTADLSMKITAIKIDTDAKPTVFWSWAGDTTGETLPAPRVTMIDPDPRARIVGITSCASRKWARTLIRHEASMPAGSTASSGPSI